MRLVYLILLVVFVAVLAVFVVQNQHHSRVSFASMSLNAPLSIIMVLSYALGMFSGWWIVGLVRRSVHSVTQKRK